MYGVDSIKNLNFLIGQELIQICFSLYQITLNFTDDISLSIEGVFQLKQGDQITSMSCHEIIKTKKLINLIGKKISTINSITGKEVNLFFPDGYCLAVMDSNKEFESFVITNKNKTIAV